MRIKHAVVVLQIAIAWFGVAATADDWPQWRGPQRDGVWRESGIIEKFDGPQIQQRWRVPISSGYSAPTVADGRVYVSDYVEEPEQIERVHCVDFASGKPLWTHVYSCDYGDVGFPAGPRAAVTINDGRAYSLGTVGHFFCLDAATGDVLWKKDLVKEYTIELLTWGIAPAPVIEGDLVIVQIGGSGGACVVAFNKDTGQEQWKALDEPTAYATPVLIDQAGRRVLVCWTGTSVSGLDPTTGDVLWRHATDHTKSWIDGIATPPFDDGRLFLSCTMHGVEMLGIDPDELKVEVLWESQGRARREGDSLHAVISTPWMADGFLYGVDYFGQFRCLDAATGERVWEDLTVTTQVIWGMAEMVRNGDKTWIFNDRGELIIARISPRGYEEISRAKLIEPTREQLRRRGGVCWSHPAFAYKHVFVRSDEALVCASLAADRRSTDPVVPEVAVVSEPPASLTEPFTVEQIHQSQQAWAEYLGLPVDYINTAGIPYSLIPPGEFTRGEQRVVISKPFYMSKHEVSLRQFGYCLYWDYKLDLDRDSPDGEGLDTTTGKLEFGPQYTWKNPGFPQTDEHPVVNLSWNDASMFCDYMQRSQGDECRLPTEAEWEYAYRLGVAGASGQAADNGHAYTAPIGTLKPDALGLYDMQGNVGEWLYDWYAADYDEHSPTVDPKGPASGAEKVWRGGSWADGPSDARRHRSPTERSASIGFRVIQAW